MRNLPVPLPINAPPGATRDEIMERICNFDFNHVIDTLAATYPASADGKEEGARHILHQLEHCRHLVQMTSQGLAQTFSAYG